MSSSGENCPKGLSAAAAASIILVHQHACSCSSLEQVSTATAVLTADLWALLGFLADDHHCLIEPSWLPDGWDVDLVCCVLAT